MSCDKPFERCAEQGGTLDYWGTLNKWDAGAEAFVPVQATEISTITLRLTNQADGAVLNGRNGVNVLNTNGGQFDPTSGRFDFRFVADDNPITAAGVLLKDEKHVAIFTATWLTGSKSWAVVITVDNLNKLAGVTS